MSLKFNAEAMLMDSGNTYAHGFPLSAYSFTSLQSREPLSSEG